MCRLLDAAPFMEAVAYHALGEQKKDECQDDYKQEVSNPERGRSFSFRAGCLRISCHQNPPRFYKIPHHHHGSLARLINVPFI
jgi:hypothetical protein